MHGFGLHFLLKPAERSNSARLAFSRPLRGQTTKEKEIQNTFDMNKIRDKWYQIENLQQNDKFLIAFFKRYGTLIYEELDKPKTKKIEIKLSDSKIRKRREIIQKRKGHPL